MPSLTKKSKSKQLHDIEAKKLRKSVKERIKETDPSKLLKELGRVNSDKKKRDNLLEKLKKKDALVADLRIENALKRESLEKKDKTDETVIKSLEKLEKKNQKFINLLEKNAAERELAQKQRKLYPEEKKIKELQHEIIEKNLKLHEFNKKFQELVANVEEGKKSNDKDIKYNQKLLSEIEEKDVMLCQLKKDKEIEYDEKAKEVERLSTMNEKLIEMLSKSNKKASGYEENQLQAVEEFNTTINDLLLQIEEKVKRAGNKMLASKIESENLAKFTKHLMRKRNKEIMQKKETEFQQKKKAVMQKKAADAKDDEIRELKKQTDEKRWKILSSVVNYGCLVLIIILQLLIWYY